MTRVSRRPFVGVDGEGGNSPPPGRHEYGLLRAGDRVLATGSPLTPVECLAFLSALPRNVIYVAYFFNYDVTMICRDMPERTVDDLLHRERRTRGDDSVVPVRWGPFEFDWLPGHEFKVRRLLPGRQVAHWTTVSDVGTFFQTSFVSALGTWGIGTDMDREAIAAGKELRASFAEMTAEIGAYNALEVELLEDLMEEFRRVCEEIGYVPKKWQGPGQLAKAVFAVHGVPRHSELGLPDGVWRMAQAAYYGGRFETTAVGWVR